MSRPLGIKTVRRQAEIMETETRRFYERAASKVTDASTRELLGDLAEAERKHVTLADNLQQEYLTPEVETQEEKAHRWLSALIWAAWSSLCIKRHHLIAPSELNFSRRNPELQRRGLKNASFSSSCLLSVVEQEYSEDA
jgi:hypothetical protein